MSRRVFRAAGKRAYRCAVIRRVWVITVHGGALAYAFAVLGGAAGGLAAAAGLLLCLITALATAGLAVAALVDGALHDMAGEGAPERRCSLCHRELAVLGSLVVCGYCDCLPSQTVGPRRR